MSPLVFATVYIRPEYSIEILTQVVSSFSPAYSDKSAIVSAKREAAPPK